MFKRLLNKTEVNHFVKSLSPLLKFSHYHEEIQEPYLGDLGYTIYTAITDNDNWKMELLFKNRLHSGVEKKQYYPDIKFRSNGVSMGAILKSKRQEIAAFFQTKYKPDFEPAMNIVDIFVKKGIEAGLFNSVELKNYNKHMSTHFDTDQYDDHLTFKDKNIATVSFNNLLQNGVGGNNRSFKKSYINVDLIHLVEPDETIKPYFKIKLPYSAHNKLICIIPLNNSNEMHITANEHPLNTGYLRKFNSVNLSNSSLEEFFESLFKTEAQNIICETLNMRRQDIYSLTIDELKEYFVLVEMVKI